MTRLYLIRQPSSRLSWPGPSFWWWSSSPPLFLGRLLLGSLFVHQLNSLFDGDVLRLHIFGQGRIDLFPLDVGAIAAFHHAHLAAIGVIAQLTQGLGCGGPTPAGVGAFFGQHFNRVVHADLEHFFPCFHVHIGRFLGIRQFVHDVGAKPAEVGADAPAFGVITYVARQAEEFQRLFQRGVCLGPATMAGLRQRGTFGFLVLGRGFPALDVWPVAAIFQPDLILAVGAQ